MKIQMLFCGPGNHEWKREAQRGPLPSYCPEHKPETKKTETPVPQIRAEMLTTALKGAKTREPLGILRLNKEEMAYIQRLLEQQSDPMAAQIYRRM